MDSVTQSIEYQTGAYEELIAVKKNSASVASPSGSVGGGQQSKSGGTFSVSKTLGGGGGLFPGLSGSSYTITRTIPKQPQMVATVYTDKSGKLQVGYTEKIV
jgi:hypothetical protein